MRSGGYHQGDRKHHPHDSCHDLSLSSVFYSHFKCPDRPGLSSHDCHHRCWKCWEGCGRCRPKTVPKPQPEGCGSHSPKTVAGAARRLYQSHSPKRLWQEQGCGSHQATARRLWQPQPAGCGRYIPAQRLWQPRPKGCGRYKAVAATKATARRPWQQQHHPGFQWATCITQPYQSTGCASHAKT